MDRKISNLKVKEAKNSAYHFDINIPEDFINNRV